MERTPSSPTPENYGRDDHSESSSEKKADRPIPRVPLAASELHGAEPKKEIPLFSFPEHRNKEAEAAEHDQEEKKKDKDLGVVSPREVGAGAQELHKAEAKEPAVAIPEPVAEATRLDVPELKSIENDVWAQFRKETTHQAPAEFTQPVTEVNMPPQTEHAPSAPHIEHEIDLNMWHESGPINLNETEAPRKDHAEQTAESIPAAPSNAGMTAEVAATEPGDNDQVLWEEFNNAVPAAMELPADERFVSSLNEPEVPAPAMSEAQPDGPDFATAEQLESQFTEAPQQAPELSQEAADQQFYDAMIPEMSPQFMDETSDDYDTTQVPPGRRAYGRANTGSGPQPQSRPGQAPFGAPGAVVGGGPAPGTSHNNPNAPNYNPVSYNTPFDGPGSPNAAPGGPGSPNLPPNTPNQPPMGPNGPTGYNGLPNNYYTPNNYDSFGGAAGPAMEAAAHVLGGAHAVEGGIIGGAIAGAVTGHMAAGGARREVRQLRREVGEQSQHINTLTAGQEYGNQQLDQLTQANRELARQQQAAQNPEQARRAVTPQELAAVAAATAAAEQQEEAARAKLAPGEKMVRAAWHDVVVDRAGNVVEGQELGAGLAGDQKVEQTPRDLTVQAAQQQASQFGALAAGQQAYTEYPQQGAAGFNPMLGSGQGDPRYDLSSGQVDPQHRLEPPRNPVATALTSPLLWVGVVVLILAFFAAAFL